MTRCRRSALSWFPFSMLGAAWLVAIALFVARPAAASPDSTGSAAIYPQYPCGDDTVVVMVRGFLPTPCDSFIGAFKVNDNTVRRITQSYFQRQCFAAPFQFFSVPVVMGRFPELGFHTIRVEDWTIIRDETGTAVDTSKMESTLSFFVGDCCQCIPGEMPAENLPYVLRAITVPEPPCPGRPTSIRLEGVFPDDCGSVVSVDSSGLALVIAPDHPVTSLCTPAPTPWSVDFPLGILAAGHHAARIRMTVLTSDEAYPPFPTMTYDGIFTFDVPRDCNQTGLLPYVDFIHVGPKQNSDGEICEGDSIQVTLGGTFPSSCFYVDSLFSYESPIAAPFALPPIIRLVVSDNGCNRIACPTVLEPWSRTLTIHGMPRGAWSLPIEEVRKLGCPPVRDVHHTAVPFVVAPPDSCESPPPYHCFRIGWPSSVNNECSAFVSPGEATSVVFGVASPVALAGLEGTLRLWGEGARIVRLETVGSAVGMSLSWTSTPEGVRFVLFALQGAPIPPTPPISPTIVPILRVHVALAPQSQARQLQLDTGWDLLGSDAEGQAVPMCMIREGKPPIAVICVEQGECDFNADGALDVRDLVLMARCVMTEQGCPADVTRFDCDGNGQFRVDDVLCCASELLRGPGCPSCPVDTVRAAPEVSVRFGPPRRFEGGLDVPIQIYGSMSVGAARLKLRFPAERFDVTGVGGRPGWLDLHQVSGNELSLGVINSFGPVPAIYYTGEPLELMLRLTSRAGTDPGGTLALLDSDFSGNDGVKLRVDPSHAVLSLGEVEEVSLSAARPNPFEGFTRFSVQLERRGPLDIGVYDLAGRRVATLFHGTADAGAQSFTWDGRTDDGTKAPGGVYFCRAVAGSQSVTRRMVMLRGR